MQAAAAEPETAPSMLAIWYLEAELIDHVINGDGRMG